MDHKPLDHKPLEHKPLDLEQHQDDTSWSLLKRWMMFILLIGLCVAFAAPMSGSRSGAMGTDGSQLWGTFEVAGKKFEVREKEFRRAHNRYSAVYRVLDPQGTRLGTFKSQDVWNQLILDEVAKAGGIHVSDDRVARFLADNPAFHGANGTFDESRYRAEMKQLTRYMGVDHEGLTWALKSLLRTEVYRSLYATAFSVPASREAYDEWKKTNLKVSVDYVAQPYDELRAKAHALPVTDADLQAARVLPKVVEMLTVPARRGLELAYARVKDISAEQRTAMEEFAAQAQLLPKDETVESVAWRDYFWPNCKPGGVYTRESWLAWKLPEYERALAAWQALPEPRPEDAKPADPRAQAWPEKPADQFYSVWFDFVAKEALLREVMRHMALRAERESKSLADIAADYARFGVHVWATPEPVTDKDIAAGLVDGIGKDSELEQAISSRLRAPASGATFTPQLLVDPVPAVRLAERPDERGWVIARSTSFEPAHTRDVLEARAEVEAYYRDYRAADLARDVLLGVRKQIDEAGGDLAAKRANLRKFAEAAGLVVRELRRVTPRTEKPRVPTVDADAAPAMRAAADRIRQRNRVQDDYAVLSRLEPGTFREPIVLDETAGAALLELVVERHEPDPIEMDEPTLRTERMVRMYQSQGKVAEALGTKELTRTYNLDLTAEARESLEKD